METLKNCPFCDGKVKLEPAFGTVISCDTCGYFMQQRIMCKDIIKAWNNRKNNSKIIPNSEDIQLTIAEKLANNETLGETALKIIKLFEDLNKETTNGN